MAATIQIPCSAATAGAAAITAWNARDMFFGVEVESHVYQQRICRKALDYFAGSFTDPSGASKPPAHSVMVESPTGSGKTIMGLEIARQMQRRYGYSIGWVAMRRNLLVQAEAENRHRRFNVDMKTISMFDKAPPHVDMLVVDEAQHDAAASMANLHCTLRPQKVLGMTATPYRIDRIKLCFDKVIKDAGIHDLVPRHGGLDTNYGDGIVTSTHTPRSGERPFSIGGDSFQHRFVMETPIDGFGHPNIYLSFLRMVCSNGMIGYGKAFRSDISLGKDMTHCIGRALDGFDNGEGYAALRQRFESAQQSWASVHECAQLCKQLMDMNDGHSIKAEHWLGDFRRMSGDLSALYGMANLDVISQKRQRVLPARCRVYDLLNFASEMATHRASNTAGRRLQAFIGSMISDEYDMEGTAQSVTDFADFFV